MSPQVSIFVEQIRKQLPSIPDVQKAALKVRSSLECLGLPFTDEMAFNLDQARQAVERELSELHVLKKRSIYHAHVEWYSGPGISSRFWPALRDYLLETKGWDQQTVSRLDEESSEIVSMLANPATEAAKYRGLVVGYVQSGKTANMTAVISKAIDAGYNMVIVLAGLTNKLRQQTQERLDLDLVQRYQFDWQLLTSSNYNGDFTIPKSGHLPHPEKGPMLAVLKKNVSPLKRILATLQKTPVILRNKLRVLLIDDECDSASVNSSSNEYDVTAINRLIREINDALVFHSYVGYTATPFANVLINPYIQHNKLDDLYPRDFITALELPEGYFGTEKLFGIDPDDADEEEDTGLDMIRIVPDSDARLLQPKKAKERKTFYPDMPESLEDSLLYFIASCAARLCRGHFDAHMTMLVHTSIYTDLHQRVSDMIVAYLGSVRNGATLKSGYLARMKELWEREICRVPSSDFNGISTIEFDQLLPYLSEVFKRLETPVENSFSGDRIDYGEKGRIYVVVGGAVLARGLTLEGLMVSYFLRSTSQYDTLLQMGRWFGYRNGYEDLPRIWMTSDLKMAFRALAQVELEIREDIRQYRDRPVTPMDLAVRIRTLPGMAITAATKMRYAEPCQMDYTGHHRQTIRFDHKNEKVISNNWQAGADLISALEANYRDTESDKVLYRNVPDTLIRSFFGKYSVNDAHKELSSEFLIGFMDENKEMLSSWNVGLYQPVNGRRADKELGKAGFPTLVRRSILDDGNDHVADIKALMSVADVTFDCNDTVPDKTPKKWQDLKAWRATQEKNPLLLLYCIDKNSAPASAGTGRVALDAVDDLLAFGVIFPGDKTRSGKSVSIKLTDLSADDLESMDEAEQEALESGS